MAKDKRIKKNFILKKNVLISIMIVLFGVFLLSGSKLILDFIENQTENNKAYTSSGSISYNVFVADNEFIPEPFLPSGRSYITSLTDYIDINMGYNYKGSVNLPLSYQYKITATLYGFYNEDPNSANNPIIWEKEFVIKEPTDGLTTTNKTININENFKIYIKDYVTEIMKFVDYFQIPTISYIELKMPISIYGEDSNYALKTSYEVTAHIVIEDKIFKVETSTVNSETNYFQVADTVTLVNPREAALYIVTLLLSLIMILVTFKKLGKYQEYQNYEQKLDKIKIDYSEILIQTSSMVSTEDLKVISIISFDELLNLAGNLTLPIMLYQKERESYFYIIKSEIIYIYVFKNNEYSKKVVRKY